MSRSSTIIFSLLWAEDYGWRLREEVGQFSTYRWREQGIQVEDEETEDLRIKGSKCLVGRLGVPKKINREAFKKFLSYLAYDG